MIYSIIVRPPLSVKITALGILDLISAKKSLSDFESMNISLFSSSNSFHQGAIAIP